MAVDPAACLAEAKINFQNLSLSVLTADFRSDYSQPKPRDSWRKSQEVICYQGNVKLSLVIRQKDVGVLKVL
ncbi:hypothetical protein RMSM_01165 [Rhodopirellula maiorica SM1]|uniref:Uncharacterized protein n=1 Tax=Rhodopirellula maiorica SM1 TaxID=1265738 RepID=M5S2R1_9BACT|nr:hypothetical protein RMSM_01165 [Rhodopirellula maiorica SM1]